MTSNKGDMAGGIFGDVLILGILGDTPIMGKDLKAFALARLGAEGVRR